MKIIVTGSLGHISKPLTQELVQKEHEVTVISSKSERKKEIEALGAKAAIGSIDDVLFLTNTFKNADAVYCMIPPNRLFDPGPVARNYTQAIRHSGVKRVVFLSSVGAHTDKGSGILAIYYDVENIMGKLSSDIAITFMRPASFYYNLLGFINGIKTQGTIASNYGGEDWVPWVSPLDIATAVAEEIVSPPEGRKVCYVTSDELTCNQVACVLGAAIGKPDLKWKIISDKQMLNSLTEAGMNPNIAAGFIEMNASIHSGELFEDYFRNRPTLGKIKMTDFTKEFATAFEKA